MFDSPHFPGKNQMHKQKMSSVTKGDMLDCLDEPDDQGKGAEWTVTKVPPKSFKDIEFKL